MSRSHGGRPRFAGWLGCAVVLGVMCWTALVVQPDRVSADQIDGGGAEVPAGHAGGIAMGGPWTWTSPEDQAEDLDRIAALGVGWIRVSFPWSAMEPRPGHFDWSTHDAIVRMARARGLEVIANVAYTPRWARSPLCFSSRCAPVLPSRYAAFLGRAVDRYSEHGVTVFEVWNEPNLAAFWRPAPDPDAYTRLLVRSHAAARRADPAVTVLSGGLAPAATDTSDSITPLTFLHRMYAAGGRGAFDAVAIHPYSYPLRPKDPHPQNPFAQLPALRQLMVANGDAEKALWITEFGYWTSPPGPFQPRRSVTPEQQAVYLAEAFGAVEGWSWAGPLIWYSYQDESPALLRREDNFGLQYHNGTPKPAWSVLRDLMRQEAPR